MKSAIVSTYYPSKGGVATYTKYLYGELSKINSKVYIIADKIQDNPKEGKNIIRCWDHNPKYIFQVLNKAIKNKIKVIHIQQELHLFGGKISAFLLPLLILLLRIFNKRVVITLHGVVPLKNLTKEFMKENGYEGSRLITKIGLNILYSSLCLTSNKIVVHEKKFKEYLKDYLVNTKKVIVIGHGINEINKLIPKKMAKTKLGIDNKYTFLYFGYVTGYKGVELIVSSLKEMKEKNFNFIIVGSPHPRLKETKKYSKYYNKLKKYFENDKRCKFFGYVQEKDVNYYFRASDCAVFPYSLQMSSSGPMALALANDSLIIASDAFKGFIPNNLLFKKTSEALIEKINEAKRNKLNKEKLNKLKNDLLWKKIAKKTNEAYKNV
jgi:glycosyltransferase involved in cell wall biosynthesis